MDSFHIRRHQTEVLTAGQAIFLPHGASCCGPNCVPRDALVLSKHVLVTQVYESFENGKGLHVEPTIDPIAYPLDKLGIRWAIFKEYYSPITMATWRILPHKTARLAGGGEAFVTVNDINDESLPPEHILTADDLRQLPMAVLQDIRVDEEVENRGVGTLLLKAIIEDCKLQGHSGIEGELSETDRDHFDKLAHWYPKNGFSIKFYDEKERRRSRNKPGRVWITFD